MSSIQSGSSWRSSSQDAGSNSAASSWGRNSTDALPPVAEAELDAAPPTPASTADVGDAFGLQVKERIHRYLDLCIPPSLVAHQRSRDGPVLVRLCAALRDFGSPREWAPFLPISAVEEDEDEGDEADHFGEGEEESAAAGGGIATTRHRFADLPSSPAAPCDVFGASPYAAECVPYPVHPTIAELRAAAASDPSGAATPSAAARTAPAVTWSTLTRHLSYLVLRLTDLLKAPRKSVGAYTLPPRLQAWVVPQLYDWLTYWPLIEADAVCWAAVARCFNAACRPPPRTAKVPAAAAVAGSGRDSTECAPAPREAGEGDSATWAYTLPWRPLALLCFSVQDARNTAVPVWLNALGSVAAVLPGLCRRAVPRFDAFAVDGLWGLVADRLATTVDGAAALAVFVQLVPYRHLCTTTPATPGARPQLTPCARHLLQFLFVETAVVPPSRRPTPALTTPASGGDGKLRTGQQGKAALAAFFVTWEQAAMLFAGGLARAHPGLDGMDALAEPLFTAWLRSMDLPSSSAASGGRGGHRDGKGGDQARRAAAGPHVRLLSAFPDDVNTPLWRQLERWVHATSVFVRPGLPCTKGSPAYRVCGCYSELAREALRRCPRRGSSSSPAPDSAGETREGAARYWNPATVHHFVELLLPCAVAAFQVRARHAFALLSALLRLDPAAVLPRFLDCVETGLQSPTEVAAQRAASTRLLTCAVPTLLADASAAASPSPEVLACRDTLVAFLRERLPSLLALVNPSALVGALPVLTLVAVTVSYAPIDAVLGAEDAVVDFAKVYTAQLIPLYAAHADAATGHYREADAVVRAVVQALPPPAVAVVARDVLREARSRDHGMRLAGLVRMVAVSAPAATWACAERHWLPVLTDPTSRDGAVEWAANLLAASVSQLGDRSLVRAHAAAIWRAAQMQLRFLSSKPRCVAAVNVATTLLLSLVLPRESPASCLRVPRGAKPSSEGGEEEDGKGVGAARGLVTGNSDAAAQPSAGSLPQPRLIGAAQDARVYVEWATAEGVQTAADLFNAAMTACVQLVTELDSDTVPHGDLAASLQRFLGASVPVPAAAGEAGGLVCESAGAVTRRSLLNGTLEWMLGLLHACEWMYVVPTQPAAAAGSAVAEAGEDREARGVAWWKSSVHATWFPTATAATLGAESRCKPAYTRDALFNVLRRHVCQPMLQRQVVAPLRGAGVELGSWLPAPASSDGHPTPTSSSPSPPPLPSAGVEEGTAEVKGLLRLLAWLVSPVVRNPQLQWRPAPSLWHFLRRSLGQQCPWVRRLLPLRCWIERSTQLQVEATVHGQLPVTQRCFSDVVTTLQVLCLSPNRPTWSAAVQQLVRVRVFGDLDTDSVAVLEGRTRAMATDVMAQWRRNAAAPPVTTGVTATKAAAASPVLPALHTVQQSAEGVLSLFVSLLLNREFFESPVACLHLLRFLVHFPEELRSVTAGLALPGLMETMRRSQIAVTGAVRSAAFVAAVVQLAHELAATYPARAALLLSFARIVYWPSPRHWLSLRAVRQLTRLSTGVHITMRCMAGDLLYTAAVAIMPREATVTVRATGDLVTPPASFGLSPEALQAEPLPMDEQRTHAAAVAAVQSTLRRLAAASPYWAFHVGTTGIVFPNRYFTLPRCVADAAGLQPVVADAPEHACALVAPTFVDVLVAASPPAAAAASYRRGWRAALLGPMDGGVTTGRDVAATAVAAGGATSSAPRAAPYELSAQSWLLRLLAIPVEMEAPGRGLQMAPPALVASLLMSLSEDTTASTAAAGLGGGGGDVMPSVTDAALLLAWAEAGLRRWRGVPRRDGVVTKEHLPEGASSAGTVAAAEAGAPASCTSDDLYRAFSHLAMVLCVVLRLTAPRLRTAASRGVAKEGADNGAGGARKVSTDDVHRRAVRGYAEMVACVCGDAAIPHVVAKMVIFASVQSLRRSLSPDELMTVVCDLAVQLLGSGSGNTAAAAAEAGQRGGGADTWSQQQVRVLLFFSVLLRSTPPAVVASLLPRLVAMTEAHAAVFFASPSDQVRLGACGVTVHLLSLATLASPLRVELATCDAAVCALLCSVLRRVNAEVFGGRLPLRCEAAERTVSTAAWPDPGVFGAATSRDAALLTVAAYCMRELRLPVLQPHLSDVVAVLCYSLDLSFTEVQYAHDAVVDAIEALIALRMPKALMQTFMDELCAVCTGTVPYGQSRRARAACTQALRCLIFPNLHRIGRFAVVEQLAAASLSALAHRDASVRAAGSEVMSVLTKVAAEAQTRVLVQRLAQELRELPRQVAAAESPTAEEDRPAKPPQAWAGEAAEEDGEAALSTAAVAMGAAPMSRRVALVQALGAILLADPGTPPSYVPRLMRQLAGCAREGNTECGRVAKRVFESWWRAHREGWAREYKACFTQAQVDAISDLFVAPLYFA